MRTISKVHTPEERLAQRRTAQLCAWRSLWRVAACASILRTAVTRLLPLCGAAAWWMTAACLAPGLVCYGLCCLALRLTRTQSLPECARQLLGRAGETALSLLCGVAVAVDGGAAVLLTGSEFTAREQGDYTLRFSLLGPDGEALAQSGEYRVRLDTGAPLMQVRAEGGSMQVTVGDSLSEIGRAHV